jgi:hypothetical protein
MLDVGDGAGGREILPSSCAYDVGACRVEAGCGFGIEKAAGYGAAWDGAERLAE